MEKIWFESDELVWYGIGVMDTWLYAFVKNYRTVHHQEWTWMDTNLKEINQDVREPQDGMQAETNESNYIKIVWPNLTEGGGKKM